MKSRANRMFISRPSQDTYQETVQMLITFWAVLSRNEQFIGRVPLENHPLNSPVFDDIGGTLVLLRNLVASLHKRPALVKLYDTYFRYWSRSSKKSFMKSKRR